MMKYFEILTTTCGWMLMAMVQLCPGIYAVKGGGIESSSFIPISKITFLPEYFRKKESFWIKLDRNAKKKVLARVKSNEFLHKGNIIYRKEHMGKISQERLFHFFWNSHSYKERVFSSFIFYGVLLNLCRLNWKYALGISERNLFLILHVWFYLRSRHFHLLIELDSFL